MSSAGSEGERRLTWSTVQLIVDFDAAIAGDAKAPPKELLWHFRTQTGSRRSDGGVSRAPLSPAQLGWIVRTFRGAWPATESPGSSEGESNPWDATDFINWAIVRILNERGERLRGKRFSVSNVHGILTNTAYCGYVLFNRRDSRTGEARPENEWVPIPVPPVVTEDVFYAVRKQMADRDPRMGETALKTNTNLLTSRAVCGCGGDGCGGGMTTATGKSGRYRYYACATRASKGEDACAGRRVPMEKLDDLVVDAVAEHLTEPARLNALLQTWLDRSATAVAVREADRRRLRGKLTQLEGESARVIKLVRAGICSPDDPQIAVELASIRAQRTSAEADIAVLDRQLDAGDRRITPAIIARFGELLERKLRGPDAMVRREYIRLLVDRVEVGGRQIRISGRKAMLERAVTASRSLGNPVPKAERKWCTRQDCT